MSKKKSNEGQQQEPLLKRLDAILNVLLHLPQSEGKSPSMLRRVEILSSSGLRNVEIAKILGISQPAVGVMLDRLRKKSKKKKR
jgi:DNA-binding MarR family transcriptional regulator